MKFLQDISPREYQKAIFESCIKDNCLVVLPTGLGKTLIALMLSIKRMQEFPGEKVVFLAPTKPLAEQHHEYFKKHLPELFAEITLFTGQVPSNKRKTLWNASDIVFSTPQCVANDLKKNLYNLNEVCLLVEDEAHRCIKNYDYNFLAKNYIFQAKHPRILGLTASPGSEKQRIKEICKNLSINSVELRTRYSPDVKSYLQELEFEKIEVQFPAEFEEIRHVLKKLFNRYVEELRSRKVLFGYASKTELLKLQKKISGTLIRGNKNYNYFHAASACAQAIKIQHALELLETQTLTSFNKYLKKLFNEASKQKSKGVVKLVAKPEFNFAYSSSNELLIKEQEHPKIKKVLEILKQEILKNENFKAIVFTQFRETATTISKNLNSLLDTNIKAKVFVGQAKKSSEDPLKKSGESTTYTGLSQKQQKKIIQDFADGKINIICATSIGEEGLDIPEVNAVIFYEPVPSAIRKIQRAGRTARLMKGKLIVLITKNTRDETFHYVARSREKKMHSAIHTIKKELSQGKSLIKDLQKKLS
ncbi:MAG: DEAD/DEAH box helicase [Candidatus Nanoarchaeia archaeon]